MVGRREARGQQLSRLDGFGVPLVVGALLIAVLPAAQAQTSSTSSDGSTTTTSTSTTSTTTSTVSPSTTAPPTTATTAPPPPSTSTLPDASTSTVTTEPGPPPASLSEASVTAYLNAIEKTSSSSTTELIAALRPFQDYGFTEEEALLMGMGRFPVAGQAYFSDDFGDPRFTPVPHTHKGTDIFAAFDTPVRSPADGVLQYSVEPLAGGNAAYVTERNGTYYYMAHLSRFAPGLASGSKVRQGQVVGFNGDTGNARGGPPHLHFEVHPGGGEAVNPKPILDRWLADARAAVPTLLAPYQQDATRSLAAVGLTRHFDRGLLAAPARFVARAQGDEADVAGDERLAAALVSPLTPPVLRAMGG